MSLHQEIQELHQQLAQLSKAKELYFSQQAELKKQLASGISGIKQQQKASLTSQQEIRNLRTSRDSLNQEVKHLIAQIKELNTKKQALFSKLQVKEDPKRTLKLIHDIDFKIQTEVLSAEKEKGLMKKIKDLKKAYGSQQEIVGLLNEISNMSGKINEKRKTADEVHKKLQNILATRQNLSSLIASSKGLLELRTRQQAAFNHFISAKSKFSELNKQLKEKLSLLHAEQKLLTAKSHQKLADRQRSQEALLQAKEKQVEEKLKNKKRLTNDDLLIFQRS
ncbi:MAG TPA: hypothetical protein VJH95_04540 [Candidatus Nanoarchaeia archaeon]|nr:hypothetical protein [Candidatus Nanoarchaeia archaeon]